MHAFLQRAEISMRMIAWYEYNNRFVWSLSRKSTMGKLQNIEMTKGQLLENFKTLKWQKLVNLYICDFLFFFVILTLSMFLRFPKVGFRNKVFGILSFGEKVFQIWLPNSEALVLIPGALRKKLAASDPVERILG